MFPTIFTQGSFIIIPRFSGFHLKILSYKFIGYIFLAISDDNRNVPSQVIPLTENIEVMKPGPGHTPRMPQPNPNKMFPTINFGGVSVIVGKLNDDSTDGWLRLVIFFQVAILGMIAKRTIINKEGSNFEG